MNGYDRCRSVGIFLRLLCLVALVCEPLKAQDRVSLELRVVDSESGKPVAARLEFLPTNKVKFKPKNSLSVDQQILIDEPVLWSPKPGSYEFSIERGPEFASLLGNFVIELGARDEKEIAIQRKSNMRESHWYSGDMRAELPADPLARWQVADDLDVVFTSNPSSNSSTEHRSRSKISEDRAWRDPASIDAIDVDNYLVEDGREGLLIHGWRPSSPEELRKRPIPMMLEAKKQPDAWVEIHDLLARDVPIWLASGRIDAVQLFGASLSPERQDSIPKEAFVPNPQRFAGRHGAARLREHIYWQILEAGLHLPPTAGSGFGVKGRETHLGYNRIYVFAEQKPDLQEWTAGVRRGNSFITNGPLLRALINGMPPGHRFELSSGSRLDLSIDLQLTVRDPVEYLDVLFNNETLYEARLEEHAKKGRFPPLGIDRSGWMVIRVVTSHESSYRAAMTAPFYFDVANVPRVESSSAQFFLDWLDHSQQRIEKDPKEWEAMRVYVEAARKFWKAKL